MYLDSLGSIDPRTLKTLLQLQMATSIQSPSLYGRGEADASSSFDDLLQNLLGTGTLNGNYVDNAQQGDYAFNLNMNSLSGRNGWGSTDGSDSSGFAGLSNLMPQSVALLLSAFSQLEANAAANKQDGVEASVYGSIIQGAASKFGVDASLIHSVIQTESSYRANAVSSAGAKGLMQLMDGTASWLGVEDSFDPSQNIYGGTKYLRYLMDKYGQQEQVALAAYNAGPGTIDRLGIATNEDLVERFSLLPTETRNYIGKVMNERQAIAALATA